MCDRTATSNNIAQRGQDYVHPTYAAYVDLHTAFDSLSRSLLWLQLTRLQIPDKIVSLIGALYRNSVSCVRASQSESAWFTIKSGVRQGCSDGGSSLKQGKGTWKTKTYWRPFTCAVRTSLTGN